MTEARLPRRLSVPSKSFFLGEYLALTGGRTLLAATLPRFELQVREGAGALRGIARESPAGRLVTAHPEQFATVDVQFSDPHEAAGGWGASAAQFLMCYAMIERVDETSGDAIASRIDVERMLAAYVDVAWDGRGAPPSGADVVAQLHGGLVEFSRADGTVRTHAWPFDDLEFYFIPTGIKVATHEHLRELGGLDVSVFAVHAKSACEALERCDSVRFVEAIRGYGDELERQSLVHPHSLALLRRLDALPGVLASKGCGALGADVVVAIVHAGDARTIASTLRREFGVPIGRAHLSHGLAIDPLGDPAAG